MMPDERITQRLRVLRQRRFDVREDQVGEKTRMLGHQERSSRGRAVGQSPASTTPTGSAPNPATSGRTSMTPLLTSNPTVANKAVDLTRAMTAHRPPSDCR